MDKANLIISIIVVLCIAAAVAAYGIINNQDAVFSDLASMNSGSGNGGNGIGNNTTHNGTSTSSSGSGSSGSSSGGNGASSGSGSGSSSGGSGSGSGSGSGGGSSSGPNYSSSQIRSIANSHIGVSGCYAGTPSYSGGYWYVTIYNSTDDSAVDGFVINDRNGFVSRG